MRTALFTPTLSAVAFILAAPLVSQEAEEFLEADTRDTYFTVHNIRPAHDLTTGAGAKVGILGYSFGTDAHPELYAGGENFQTEEREEVPPTQCHHGYWMALALHQIAPEAKIFTLNTYSTQEGTRVAAMVKAIDWAIEHELDAITYSAESFSPQAREILDPALERAVHAGVVAIFTDYPHPDNLFPAGIGPRVEKDQREPDLNIFHSDETVVFGDSQVAFINGSDDQAPGNRPFLSISSTAPVTAGFVAILRSLDPTLSPARIKKILIASSHPMEMGGRRGERVPDLGEAVSRVRGDLVRR